MEKKLPCSEERRNRYRAVSQEPRLQRVVERQIHQAKRTKAKMRHKLRAIRLSRMETGYQLPYLRASGKRVIGGSSGSASFDSASLSPIGCRRIYRERREEKNFEIRVEKLLMQLRREDLKLPFAFSFDDRVGRDYVLSRHSARPVPGGSE